MALVVKNPPANAGGKRLRFNRWVGREETGNPLQCPCLEKSTDRGAWRAAVHGAHRVRRDGAAERKQAAGHHLQ